MLAARVERFQERPLSPRNIGHDPRTVADGDDKDALAGIARRVRMGGLFEKAAFGDGGENVREADAKAGAEDQVFLGGSADFKLHRQTMRLGSDKNNVSCAFSPTEQKFLAPRFNRGRWMLLSDAAPQRRDESLKVVKSAPSQFCRIF